MAILIGSLSVGDIQENVERNERNFVQGSSLKSIQTERNSIWRDPELKPKSYIIQEIIGRPLWREEKEQRGEWKLLRLELSWRSGPIGSS